MELQVFLSRIGTQNNSNPRSQHRDRNLPDYYHRTSAPLGELLGEWKSKILIIKPFSTHRILVTTGKSLLNCEEYKVASITVIK